MKRFILILVLTFLFNTGNAFCAAAGTVTYEDWGQAFTGFKGTFVLYDRNNDQYSIYNDHQADVRLSPCSTFKIYHALIGLECGVLAKEDANTRLQWNGTQYAILSWNRDHTMSSAISNSVVWYFQEVAAQIGNERMQAYLDKLQYGNEDISGGINRFWLGSTLKISAKEQVELLKKLYSDQLPLQKENMAIVKKDIILSDSNQIIFSGKTGSAYLDGKCVLGWFVGCVERDGNQYLFATNIEADDGAYSVKAREITIQILQMKNLL